MPAGQHRLHTAVDLYRDYLVCGLAALYVPFPHTHQDPAIGGEQAVGEAVACGNGGIRRHRVRLLADLVPVDSLIREVREVDDSVIDPIRSAAILVDAIAYVVALGCNVDGARLAVRPGQSHDDVSAALSRPSFEPVDIRTVGFYLAEPDAGLRDHFRRDRRMPCSVRRSLLTSHQRTSFLARRRLRKFEPY